MKIKERFRVFTTPGSDDIHAVYDHVQEKYITELEAEKICQEKYGKDFQKRTQLILKTIDLIVAEMEHYNEICEEGFEITTQDIINNLKSKK